MDQKGVGIRLEQSTHSGVAAMRRPVIDDPKYAMGRPIRLLCHDLGYQAAKGFNTRMGFAASYDKAPLHIPGRQILQGATPVVLMLDAPLAPHAGPKLG